MWRGARTGVGAAPSSVCCTMQQIVTTSAPPRVGNPPDRSSKTLIASVTLVQQRN